VDIRDYQPNDERDILTLFEQVFHKKRSVDMWSWRYMQNPNGRGIIKLMWDGSRLVGHYAVCPTVVFVDGMPYGAALSTDTMVHPECWKQGIFTRLATACYDECAKRGIDLVYGFPNLNSYDTFVGKLGWTGFGKMPVWNLDLGNIYTLAMPMIPDWNPWLRQVGEFGLDVGKVLWPYLQTHRVIVSRGATSLNWRYVQNPVVKYVRYVDTRAGILGYVVFKVLEDKGFIVDALCGSSIIHDLLGRVIFYMANEGVKSISCYMNDERWAPELIRFGFTKGLMEKRHFGVKLIADSPLESALVLNNWYITQGDSDTY